MTASKAIHNLINNVVASLGIRHECATATSSTVTDNLYSETHFTLKATRSLIAELDEANEQLADALRGS